ncbi:styrene monooxygenase/indole monooxygenase family protein [Paraburkholderia phenoliruptrix]|uniref:styrene monooxygenase/indole monooxygenase family protein n=1 Tax=Paraburkholderia phenoliruptrix TaxID=252970 RepID=UPI001C6DDEAD|nr:styrene monooxygenase/indole monooxygenase family protein [Paraburkholderia phenoliruptrix]MBW9107425.1 FAD-binding oxidoreductase [Paraburkholderia phenoliruptrix]MBW9128153.1 FAD-binding oxidoreductase [Paraburkholderia ginsengiterrae]
MSQRIAIVGAGQSGLQMALALQAKGYQVTLLTNRTGEQIRAGKVLSSQGMFNSALQIERDLGLNMWDDTCPPVEGIGLNVLHPEQPGTKVIEWITRPEYPGQAVDQRLKMPVWMETFTQRGGDLRIVDVGVAELEELTQSHDLVLLAAGKGEIVSRFERDAARSPFTVPQRSLALTYVTGMTPRKPFAATIFNVIPGVGEYFSFPALTLSGPCEIMIFEGLPGGPMDRWAEARTPEQHLAESLRIVRTYLPWEAERCEHVELTDDNGVLSGRFAPTVRKPVMTLPSGRQVFGMADAVVVNDPLTGQGSNSAAKCAKIYLDAILERGDRPFDTAWMEATFARYWDYAQYVVNWTNSMLQPPQPHIMQLLDAASRSSSLASRIVSGFDNPPDLFPWWSDAQACQQLIEQYTVKAA